MMYKSSSPKVLGFLIKRKLMKGKTASKCKYTMKKIEFWKNQKKSGKKKTVLKSTQMNKYKIWRGLVNNFEGIRQNDFVT